ncbi:MAG: ATP-binding protein, partial [Gammaproteobacteria bacterium]|nr:ATP-binding protein [Gammaproteobacteria bacterium]
YNLWETKIDLSQLNQLLVNLCVNAKDAMNGSGNITIKTSNIVINDDELTGDNTKSGEYVLLTVSDTGNGIAKNEIENIFEPFYTTKSMYVNNGLGLSAVYGIVKQNDGFIDVDSDEENTTFKIYLPRCGIL